MRSSEDSTKKMSLTARLLWAAAVGGVLFALGYWVNTTGWLPQWAQSGHVSSTDNSEYSRQQMAQDRDAYKKDKDHSTPRIPTSEKGYYQPPNEEDISDDEYGEAVRRGRDVFTETGLYAKNHVGNDLACVNCHLDKGKHPSSAPMWAALVNYPKYRGKNESINTIEDRMNGCFTYSMNAQDSPSGEPPPSGSDIYRDLETYFHWLANGVPTGENMPGGGYPDVPKPEEDYDLLRGQTVYMQNCMLCHGADGQGEKSAEGKVVFPPLWGSNSFNWGAGMARIDTATGFIKANMPLAKPYSLSDQEAWDVAAFINSHERPKDTRQTGTVEETRKKYHKNEESYYGKEVNGKLLGGGAE